MPSASPASVRSMAAAEEVVGRPAGGGADVARLDAGQVLSLAGETGHARSGDGVASAGWPTGFTAPGADQVQAAAQPGGVADDDGAAVRRTGAARRGR